MACPARPSSLCPPRPASSARTDFLWALAGNSVYSVSQWLMLVILAKLTSPETVGRFALGLAVTAPVFLLTNLNLRAVLATDAGGEFTTAEYSGLRAVGTGAALLLVAGILLAGFYAPAAATAIGAVALLKAAESASDIYYGAAQRRGRLDRMAASLVLRGALSVAVLGIALASGAPLPAAVALIALAWVAVLCIYDRAGERAPVFHRASLVALVRRSWPLGVVTMLLSLNLNLPRYFLERSGAGGAGGGGGAAAVGIFSALAYFLLAGNLLMTAVAQSAAPRLAGFWLAGDRAAFGRLLAAMFGVALSAGLAALAVAASWGPELLAWVYRPEYAAQPGAFVVLMAAAAVQYLGTVLGTAVTAMRVFAAQIPIHLAATAVTLVLCPLLVPSRGLAGAAWVTLAGALVSALPYAFLLWRSSTPLRSPGNP